MYAFKITDFTDSKSRPEKETNESLGGITIGIPLIFKSNTDEFTFSSPNRDYRVRLNGSTLELEHTISEEKAANIQRVQYSEISESIDADIFSQSLDFLNSYNPDTTDDPDRDEALTDALSGLEYDDIIAMEQDERSEFFEDFDERLLGRNEAFDKLVQFMRNGEITNSTINIMVGDKVSISDTNFQANLEVVSINGNLITVRNGDIEQTIDLTNQSIFKTDKYVTQNCPKIIPISYGK